MENEIKQDLLLGFNPNENGALTELPAKEPDETDEGCFGRPEKYDYSQVELPENYCYNNEMLEEFNSLAAKYNLSQRSANELMSMAVKMAKMAGENFNKELEVRKNNKINEYKTELINNREIGGTGFEKTMQTANFAYKTFAGEDVQNILQETGLNCHPGIVKMFYEIGKKMRNDEFFGVASPAVKKESREDILFPTM